MSEIEIKKNEKIGFFEDLKIGWKRLRPEDRLSVILSGVCTLVSVAALIVVGTVDRD
jgi:hypothetical protein